MLRIFLLTLFIFHASFVGADTSEPAKPNDMEHVVVEHNDILPSLNKQIINRDAIAASASSLSEILASLSAVQVRRIGGLGNPTSVSIRGSTHQQVNVRIDGQLINSSQYGGFDLDQIPLALVESIEVSQFQTGETGPTPIGGEIRINTFKAEGNHTSAAANFGSWGHRELNAKHSWTYQQHQLVASLNQLNTNNDYTYLVPQSFANPQLSATEPLRNNAFSKTSLFIANEIERLNSTTRMNIQFNKQNKEQPNYQNNSPENTSNLKNQNLRIGLEQVWHSGASPHPLSFEAYWFDKKEKYSERPTENRYDTYDYDNHQFYMQFKRPVNIQTAVLTPYANLNHQTFASSTWLRQQRPDCNGIQSCDIKAQQIQMNLGARFDGQLNFQPIQYSVLYNHLFAQNENTPRFQPDSTTYTDDFDYASFEGDLNYILDKQRYSLHLAQGIRPPTLSELFGDQGLFKGNENLEAEKAHSITFNALWLWQNLYLQNTLYYQDIDNTIVAIFNSSGIGSYTNVASSYSWGWSGQMDYKLSPKLSFSANIDLIDSTTRSRFVAFDNKKLPGIYHQQFQLRANYQLTPEWQVSFITKQQRELYFDRANKISNRTNFNTNRNTTRLSLSWQQNNYVASIVVNNLFDQAHYDLANRPAPGRNIQFKITVKEF